MRAKILLIAAVLLALAPTRVDDQAKKDREMLQGEWTLVSGERNGEPIPEDLVKSLKRTIKGDTFTVTRDDQPLAKGTFTLDPSKKPKAYDFKLEGMDNTMHGIYELESDTFKLCYATEGDRPKEFAAPASSGHTFAIWKRAKK
jgi:uncharacterized protein (TIGR03067 family)